VLREVWHAVSGDRTVLPIYYEYNELHLLLPTQPKLVLVYYRPREGVAD